MITRAIQADLTYNAPHLEIDLDAAKPSPAIDNLVRAKILRVTGKTDGNGLRPKGRLVLMLTARCALNMAEVDVSQLHAGLDITAAACANA